MSIVPHVILDEAECRICFETHSTQGNPLMHPCLCRGTSKWVHKACIQHWRDVNRGGPYFLKCNTCSHDYKLANLHPRETYKFQNYLTDRLTRTYWYFFAAIFCLSALLRPLDKYLDYPGLYLLTNFKKPNMEVKYFFINNEIYNLDYCFCIIVLFITCFLYITTFARITLNVESKLRYWYHGGLQYGSLLLLSLHLFFFGIICNGNARHIEGMITFETLLSSFNILLFGAALISHNNIIDKLNFSNSEEIYNLDQIIV